MSPGEVTLANGSEGHELGAAFASTLLGWLALSVFIGGPLYTSASTTIYPNGVAVNSPTTQTSLLHVGLTPQSAALLAAIAMLFGLVSVLAAVHVRTRRTDAWRALLAVTVPLFVLVVLGSMTVGLWLIPGVAFAVVAVWLGRPVQPSARASDGPRLVARMTVPRRCGATT